jgi:asparagine synthase (glutamine-hydrolysing)
MCGIAGYLDRGNSRGPAAMRSLAGAMAERLAHRGPDDHGTWAEPESGIALGHRRLSILDLSPAGHQPMLSASGRFVIAFNGEVYNYLALRDELQGSSGAGRAQGGYAASDAAPAAGAGLELRGHSDTEVILAAFERWGVEASVPRLEGMFAIAAWDCQERVLWLARDRAGKKPLYYGWFGRSLLFASELKAFRAHPEFRGEIDPDAVAAYFRFGYVPAPLSIYRGVRKLPAASWLRIPLRIPPGGEECPPHEYWSLGELVRAGLASPYPGSDEEATQELDGRLRKAVRQRMIASDVPVGLFLSGGVDSATVTALAQAQSSVPIRTFSIGMSSTEYDESQFAEGIARHLGTEHTAWMLTAAEAMTALREIPAIYDEPFADSSAIPTLLVSRLARRQVTVALSGDGGDEMFGGYNRHIMAASAWPMLRSIPRRLRSQAARATPWDGMMRGAGAMIPARFRLANLPDKAHKIARAMGASGSLDLYLRLISCWMQPSDIVSDAVRLSRPAEWIPGAAREWLSEELAATSMMLADARLYMHDDILVKVDRAGMAASLEVRNPFLDAQVIEFACALPLSLKIRDGVGKWIVRKVMDRYIPRELTARPKMGFAIPLTSWLRGPLRDWAEALLHTDELSAGGFVDRQAAGALWSAFLAGRGGLTDRLWCLLMFQAWLEAERSAAAASLPGLSHP